MKKLIFLNLLVLSLMLTSAALGQTMAADDDASAVAVSISQDISAQDFDLSEPTILPDNIIGYFFKNLGRSLQSTLAFNPEKKAELQLRFANERLLEAQKLAEQKPDDFKVKDLIVKNQEFYQALMDKVNQKIEDLKNSGQIDQADKLLEKITDRQFKHQQLMENIQIKLNDLTEDQKQKFDQIKEQALKKYGEMLEKVEVNREKVQEKLQKVLETSHNPLRDAKNLEIINRLQLNLSDSDLQQRLSEIKDKLSRQLIENTQANADPAVVEKLKTTLTGENVNPAAQLKVLNSIGEQLKNTVQKNEKLRELNRVVNQAQNTRVEVLKKKLEDFDDDSQKSELLKPLENGDVASANVLQRLRNEIKNRESIQALNETQQKQAASIKKQIDSATPAQAEKVQQMLQTKLDIKNIIQNDNPEVIKKLQAKTQAAAKQRLEQQQAEQKQRSEN